MDVHFYVCNEQPLKSSVATSLTETLSHTAIS